MLLHSRLGWYCGTAIAVGVSVLAASQWPLAVPVVLVVFALVVVAAKKPDMVAAILVIASIPLLRPNVLGETFALVGTALCLMAALIAFAGDRGKLGFPRPYLVTCVSLSALYIWLLVNASMFGTDGVVLIFQGAVTTALTVTAVGFVLASPSRRRLVGKGFVYLVLALCVSYTITFAVWVALGIGALPVATFQIRDSAEAVASVFFPFTPSFGVQGVFGVQIPRFTGLGREPGWMALYCGLALLLWPRVGKPRLLGQFVLVVGLLGTVSTAGFGGFVVVVIVAWIMRRPSRGDAFTNYIALVGKLSCLAGAIWIAFFAPVLGLGAKDEMNAVSLNDRTTATQAGLDALVTSPLGGVGTGLQESINLIASIAPFGVPFGLLVIAALFLPRLGHPSKHMTTAPIALIFITLLLSQPAGDSTFVFILAGLVYVLVDGKRAVAAPSELGAPGNHGATEASPIGRSA